MQDKKDVMLYFMLIRLIYMCKFILVCYLCVCVYICISIYTQADKRGSKILS